MSSVFISGMVFSDGAQNFLDAVLGPRRGHGFDSADLVEPGAHAAALVVVLVGGVQERMVWVEASGNRDIG